MQTREQAHALVDCYAERRWQSINFLASLLVRRAFEQVWYLCLMQRLLA
jgi:hypothetical protein